MFKRKPLYTIDELASYIDRIGVLDRLKDKAEGNYRLNGKQDSDKAVLDKYQTALLVSLDCLDYMQRKVMK